MSTEREHKLPRPPRGRRSSSAVEKRTVRRVGARIFADLLPQSTRDPAPLPATPPSGSLVADTEGVQSHDDTRPVEHTGAVLRTPASPAEEETFTMRAYRTQSQYY